MTSQISSKVPWWLYQPIPSGLGCISCGTRTYCCSSSLGSCKSGLCLQQEGHCSTSLYLPNYPLEWCVKSSCQWRVSKKSCWGPQPSACPLLLACLYWSLGVGLHLLGLSFSGLCTCRSLSYFSLFLLPSPVTVWPWPSWPHSYTAYQYLYTLPRLPVPASTHTDVL